MAQTETAQTETARPNRPDRKVVYPQNCYIDLNGKGIYLGSKNVRCGNIMRSAQILQSRDWKGSWIEQPVGNGPIEKYF